MTSLALDMFTDIIAVHWSNKGFTKLDFVNDRYMVAGKDQDVEDVLGDELAVYRESGATQRSYRTDGVGIDLRKYNSFGLQAGGKTVYLKNKIDPPTKKDPGALNELLFAKGTYVMEFDWEDVVAALNAESPGGFPDGWDAVYDIITNKDWTTGEVLIVSNTELQLDRGETSIASMYWTYEKTGNYTIDDIGAIAYEYQAFSHFSPDRAAWTIEVPPPTVNVDNPPGSLVNLSIGDGPGSPFYFWHYPYPETSWTLWGDPPGGPYTIQPELAVYEMNGATPNINGRLVGARPDTVFNTPSPMTAGDGQLPAPYGRVRIAFNVGPEFLSVSVNGHDPVTLKAPPLFTRQPPLDDDGFTRLTYFPIYDYLVNHRSYEIFFSFVGIVRCIWHFKKQKPDQKLKVMSAVQPLPDADSTFWKRPPGQDQE